MELKTASLKYSWPPHARLAEKVMRAFDMAVKAADSSETYLYHRYTFPRGHTESFPGTSLNGHWKQTDPRRLTAHVNSSDGEQNEKARMVVFSQTDEALEVIAPKAVLDAFQKNLKKVLGVTLEYEC
ncbi:MAG: hypothetical protein LRY76_04835 [Alphaproteobacteria bacterium]|nr:hypothetical protein [Alphaproteobacteria bacterium]